MPVQGTPNESVESADSESGNRTWNRRQFLAGTSAVAGVMGLAGCTAGGSGGGEGGSGGSSDGGSSGGSTGSSGSQLDEVSMEIGSSFEPGHIVVETANMFAERMKEESGGRFQVTVTAGGAYGSESEITELVSGGTLSGFAGGTIIPFLIYSQESYPLLMPFLIKNWEQKKRVYDSELVQDQTIPKVIENGNQRPLGQPVYRGQRHTLTKKPVRSPEDIKGLNIRMPQIESWVEIWSELGAKPTPVALDELYSALNSGVVSASEGPAEMVSSFNLDEVLTHMAKTGHRIEPGSLFFNEDFYSGLDETYQDMMAEVADEVTEEASQKAIKREGQLLDELSESMTILEPPEVNRDAFYTKAEPALERMFDKKFVGTLEEIRQM